MFCPGFAVPYYLGFENLLIIEDAITRISKEDFDGHKLLFNDTRSMFEEQHRALRLLCQGFDLLAVEQQELPIDLDLVRSVLENDVTELISRWRDLARLGMLDRFGERGAFRIQAQRALTRPVTDVIHDRECMLDATP